MNSKILNREFQHPTDGWYQIEPKGNHPNRASKVVQVIDDEAIQTIVNRFNADADAGELSHGHEMLIDHEHFKHDSDKETIAYGWLGKLQNRDDGIYGQIRWTNTGKTAVDGGDYRFFSTEYDPADLKVLNQGNMRRARPLKLDGLTLTNDPNNKGGKPITNRDDKKFADSSESAANQNKNTKKIMNKIATKLGLAAKASEDAILEVVTKLLNRGDISATDLTTLQNRKTELEAENQTLLGEQVDGLLAEHKITDAKVLNRLKPMLKPLKNRAERLECLTELGYKAGAAKTETRVLNRNNGGATAADRRRHRGGCCSGT